MSVAAVAGKECVVAVINERTQRNLCWLRELAVVWELNKTMGRTGKRKREGKGRETRKPFGVPNYILVSSSCLKQAG